MVFSSFETAVLLGFPQQSLEFTQNAAKKNLKKSYALLRSEKNLPE